MSKLYQTKLSLAQLERMTASAEWSAKFAGNEREQLQAEGLLKLLRPALELARFANPAEITLTIGRIEKATT